MKQSEPSRRPLPARIALWQQLQQAARLVQAVLQGSSAPAVLEAMPLELRAGVQAVGYQTLRRLGMARWLREQLVPKSPPALVDALLCTALALAWRDDSVAQGQDRMAEDASRNTGDAEPRVIAPIATDVAEAMPEATPYNAFTLVNQAVEAARRHPRMRHHSGLVNACLRNFLRAQQQWQMRCRQASPEHDPALLNLPAWWLQRLRTDYPEEYVRIVHAGQQQPAMHLRVNARRMTPAQYLEEHLLPAGLQGRYMAATAFGWTGLALCSMCRALRKGGCRCRMPPRNWQRLCCCRLCKHDCRNRHGACWTPVPLRVEKPPICWNWATMT